MSARGEVRYRLTADTKDFESGFKRAEKQLDTTAQKMGKFADATGRTATTLARSASTFGLPVDALRKLDDAMDVAEIGFNNLSKAAVGFNAATLGVVGAGLAIGTMLGGWLRHIKAVEEFADRAAMALRRLFTSQAQLDRQALGDMSQKDWLARSGIAGTHAGVRSGLMSHLQSAGSSDKTLKKFGFEKEVEDANEAARKREEAQRKLSALLDHEERVTKNVTASITAMFDAQGEAFMAAHAIENTGPMRLPKQRDLGIGAAMAGGLVPGVHAASAPGFGSRFGSALMGGLPGVLLGALQGGGNIGKSFGGFLGGTLGGTLGKAGTLLGSLLPGVGTIIGGLGGGLLGKALGGIGKLFGFGGPSKEEREAERQAEEAKKERIRKGALASRAEGISGLMEHGPAFFMAKGIGSAEEAERAGTQFVAAWSAVVKEKGPAAAAEAFGGAFDKMRDEILGKGLELPAWMKSVEGQMGLGRNAAFAGVANTARTGASFLGALGSAGGLTGDVFRSFEQEARAAFAGGKAIAGGEGLADAEATKAGFSAANPLLKELVNQSVLGDHTLSADIQEMVKAQGIVPDVEFQQLDELRAIRAAVTGLGGASPSGGGGSGGYSGGFAPGGDGIPQFHSGGYTGKGGLALLHPDEFVVPGHRMRSGGRGNVSVTVNVGGTNATPDQIAAAAEVGVRRALRGGRSGIPRDLEQAGFVRRK